MQVQHSLYPLTMPAENPDIFSGLLYSVYTREKGSPIRRSE